uniref:Uncharacterized protein n=1 Tax=Cacopsylla melanoneura TaxID=428564 RepID=A0A8D8XQD0_9HEMI
MGPEASSPEEGGPGWSISSIYQSTVFVGVLTWILYLLWRHLRPKGLTEKIESELLHKLSQQILKSCSVCEKLLPFHSRQQCKCCSTSVCTECCIEQDCPKCYLEKSTSSLLQSSKFQSDLKQKLKVTLASLGVANGGGGGGGEGKCRDAEVRELMEKLVESLVEEDLDQTPITPVTTHPSYVRLFTKYHALFLHYLMKLSRALHLTLWNKSVPRLESTETVQAQLKSLIVQVLREANSLPNIQLNAAHQKSGNAENLKSKSYEDILATTILNKIVEKSQLTKQEVTPSEASSTEGRNSQTTLSNIPSFSDCREKSTHKAGGNSF